MTLKAKGISLHFLPVSSQSWDGKGIFHSISPSPPSSPLCNTPADTVRWRKGSLVWSTNTWCNRSVIAAIDYRDASALISKPEGGYNFTKFQKFVSNGCAKISKFTNLTIFCWNLRRILHNFSPFFLRVMEPNDFQILHKNFCNKVSQDHRNFGGFRCPKFW